MPLPLILGGIAIAAIAVAITYFFTSNNAAQHRKEYEGKIQQVLDLLLKKTKLLKQKIDETRAENEQLKEELKRTREEAESLGKELKRWKGADTFIVSAPGIIFTSGILSAARWSPQKALSNLDERAQQLQSELDHWAA